MSLSLFVTYCMYHAWLTCSLHSSSSFCYVTLKIYLNVSVPWSALSGVHYPCSVMSALKAVFLSISNLLYKLSNLRLLADLGLCLFLLF